EGGVHRGGGGGGAAVVDDCVEDLEAAPARDGHVGASDRAEDRGLRARPERRDRLHVAAVLVAERQPVEQILDGDEARAFEVRGLPRTHTLEKLERSTEEVTLHGSEAPPQTAEIVRRPAPLRCRPRRPCPASRGLGISEGEPTGPGKLASFVAMCASEIFTGPRRPGPARLRWL